MKPRQGKGREYQKQKTIRETFTTGWLESGLLPVGRESLLNLKQMFLRINFFCKLMSLVVVSVSLNRMLENEDSIFRDTSATTISTTMHAQMETKKQTWHYLYSTVSTPMLGINSYATGGRWHTDIRKEIRLLFGDIWRQK